MVSYTTTARAASTKPRDPYAQPLSAARVPWNPPPSSPSRCSCAPDPGRVAGAVPSQFGRARPLSWCSHSISSWSSDRRFHRDRAPFPPFYSSKGCCFYSDASDPKRPLMAVFRAALPCCPLDKAFLSERGRFRRREPVDSIQPCRPR